MNRTEINLIIEKLESNIDQFKLIIDGLNKDLEFFKNLSIKCEQGINNSGLGFTNVKLPKEQETNNTDSDTNDQIEQLVYSDEEIWKDIEMYGIKFNYQISNHSKVRNSENKIMTTSLRDGYKSVKLTYRENNNSLYKAIKIHRMVAIMFIDNDDPDNKNTVNHIDGNKFNNHHSNLEWVTIGENNKHAMKAGLVKITKRSVNQYDTDSNLIQTFESLDLAKKTTGIDDGAIAKVCKGYRKTAGGFIWKYTDENSNEVELDEDELEGYVQINNFPNYIINKTGRIYSKPYKKFLKTQKARDGAEQVQITNNGDRKTYLVHILMAETFLGKEVDSDISVYHINGNKSDNRLVNLKLGSHIDRCKNIKEIKMLCYE